MARRFHRFVLYPLAASVPAVGLLFAGGPAADASSANTPAHSPAEQAAAGGASPSAQAAALARNVIHDLLIGQDPTNEIAGSTPKIDGLTNVQSHNWAGYADSGSGFSKVSASWNEPTTSCGLGLVSISAFWVGIDGAKSGSVEQDGTMVECYLGAKYQYTWWEMYPTNSVQTVGSTVAAGDHITASVTRSGTSYRLSVTDSTRPANSFSTTQSCSNCANTSAEWVAEAPGGQFGQYSLTKFGTWSPSAASATAGSKTGTISSFSDEKITMVGSSGDTLATPGALNSGGNAFSVSWKNSR